MKSLASIQFLGVIVMQSIVRKTKKKNCKSFELDKSSAVSMGTTAVKPDLSVCPVGLQWFGLQLSVVKCTAAIFFLMVDWRLINLENYKLTSDNY